MKTIFIPIFQGVEARSILRTGIFSVLKSNPQIRLILFVRAQDRKEYFEKEFFGDNVIYEVTPPHRPSRWQPLLDFLKFNLINSKTIDLKRSLKLEQDKNYLAYFAKLSFNRIFARQTVRKLVRFLDYLFIKDDNYTEYFEKYKPDLVFLAHLFSDSETSFLKQARKFGVGSIGLITSWDKITGRCMIRLLPDKFVVYNDTIKDEAVNYLDMKPHNVSVVGVPQYDFYFNNSPQTKSDFLRDLGLPPGKRVVVFAPSGRERGDADRGLIRLIDKILKEELAGLNAQLVVRFPPNDLVDLDDDILTKGIIFQKPGHKFSGERGVDWDMNFDELKNLINTLANCDLVISLTSSIAIDAALFDKPVINVKFNDFSRYPLMKKPTRYFETEHYRKLLTTGGVKTVSNEEELTAWIRNYINDNSTDKGGRTEIVKQQCWKYDGKSGERAAEFILSNLQ